MAVSRKAMTEGIRTPIILCALIDAALQSLSQKSKIFASSLYTREPWVLPHQCVPPKCSFSSRFDNLLVKNQRFLPAVHCGMTATGSHGNFDSLRGAPPFTQGSRWVLPHQCVVSDDSGTEKPRPEKSGRGGNMRDTGNQPLTEPAVTPLMMNLLRQMYTTTTGKMASRMNMYTLPMSNLE